MCAQYSWSVHAAVLIHDWKLLAISKYYNTNVTKFRSVLYIRVSAEMKCSMFIECEGYNTLVDL